MLGPHRLPKIFGYTYCQVQIHIPAGSGNLKDQHYKWHVSDAMTVIFQRNSLHPFELKAGVMKQPLQYILVFAVLTAVILPSRCEFRLRITCVAYKPYARCMQSMRTTCA